MSTKTTFFKNITITCEGDIQVLINTFKSCLFTDDEKKKAVEEVIEKINDYSQQLFGTALNNYCSIPALIPAITLTDDIKTNSNKRKKTVLNATAYPVYSVQEANGTYTVTKKLKPFTVHQLYKHLTDMEGNKHADGKTRKDDCKKALLRLLTPDQIRELNAFRYAAYKHLNIIDTAKDTYYLFTDEQKKTYIDVKPSNAQAEKHIKALAGALNISSYKYKKAHGLALYHACVKSNNGQQTLSSIINILHAFIVISRYALNEIELPDVKDGEKNFSLFEDVKSSNDEWTF